MKVGEAFVEITGDNSKLKRELRASERATRKSTRKMDRQISTIGDAFDNVSDRISGFAATMRQAAAGAVVALAGIGTSGYYLAKTASDIEELQNLTEVAFGDMADQIRNWSAETADSINRSRYQIQEFTAQAKSMVESMVDSEEEANAMSKNITKLSYDLASLRNISDERAFQAITSAITGEAEALKRLGYNVQQSALEQYALNQGIEEGVRGMDLATKTSLRYQLITEKLSDAQGDAERTSDSFRNQVKALKADVRDLAVEYGENLIPAAKGIVSATSDVLERIMNLDESAQDFIISIGKVGAALSGAVIGLALLATAAEVAIKGLGLLASIAGVITSPIFIAGAAIAAAALLAYTAWNKNWGGIRDKLAPVIDKIKEWAAIGKEALSKVISFSISKGKDIWNWLKNNIDLGFNNQQTQWIINAAATANQWIEEHLVPRFETAWEITLVNFEKIKNMLENLWKTFGVDPKASGGGGEITNQLGMQLKNTESSTGQIGMGFADGGYTGSGGKSQPAGVVHAGEYVLPKWMVERFPNLVGMLEGMRQGYKSGGGVGFQAGGQVPSIPGMGSVTEVLDGLQESFGNLNSVLKTFTEVIIEVLNAIGNTELGKKLGLEDLGTRLQNLFNDLFSSGSEQAEETKKENEKQAESSKKVAKQTNVVVEQLKTFGKELGSRALSAVKQNPVVQSGMKGFQSGGPAGAIAGIMSESKQFGKIMEIINPLLQTLANSLGMMLKPIIPLANIISQTLAPIMRVLGTVLKTALMPVFRALFPVVKYLGIILTTVTLGIMKVYNFFAGAAEKLINGIIGLINKIPGIDFGKVNLTVDTSGVEKSLEQLKNSSFESAGAIKNEKEQRDKLNETIRNSVSGFKVALTRFNVSDPRVPSAAVGGTVQSSGIAEVHRGEVIMNQGQQAAAGGTHVHFHGDVYGQRDFDRKVDEAVKKADRKRKLSDSGLART